MNSDTTVGKVLRKILTSRPRESPRTYASPFFWIPFVAVSLFAGLIFLDGMGVSRTWP